MPLVTSAKAIWDFEGINCTSRHIPGVKFAGLIHPGILGCAPSPEILAEWNKREGELIQANTLDRDVALPPLAQSVHVGSGDDAIKEKVGKEGARTVPGRPEHGGNCDIKNLSRGSKVYLPVHVKGAKFSVGDLHFSQGDGEVSAPVLPNGLVLTQDTRSPSVVPSKSPASSLSISRSSRTARLSSAWSVANRLSIFPAQSSRNSVLAGQSILKSAGFSTPGDQ